jgi:hypothetical protein
VHGASGFEANSAQSHGLKDEERIKSSAQALWAVNNASKITSLLNSKAEYRCERVVIIFY